MSLSARVRAHCAAVAARARWISIDVDAASYTSGVTGLDLPEAPAEETALRVLALDAVNFGSGWLDELGTDTNALTAALTAHGAWPARELRALDAAEVGRALGLDPAHELTRLYAQALRDLGGWLGERTALEAVGGGSADALASALAAMPFYADTGFYKRAQITVNDLALVGVAEFADLDDLTVFADNFLPHVLRIDGVLRYAPELAALVDAGELIPVADPMEVELRACAVHACEQLAARAGVPPRTLDNWLWNRALEPPYGDGRPHLTRTVYY